MVQALSQNFDSTSLMDDELSRESRSLARENTLRALVVDDEPVLVQVVCGMLENLNIRVDAAHGGREAMQCLEEGNYDLLVSDLQMPHMSGYELAGWAKFKSREMKVVIMTGSPEVDTYRSVGSSPVDCWLFKPFSFQELKTLLRELLRSRLVR